jgi:hypothetical protein
VLEKKSDREDKALETVSVFIGIDVSKARLEVSAGPMGSRESFANAWSTPEYSSRDQELSELAGELKVVKKMSLATRGFCCRDRAAAERSSGYRFRRKPRQKLMAVLTR